MADIREIYGADAWNRETFDLVAEEAARIAHGSLTSNMLFALPVQVTETSQDLHNAVVQPTVKRAIIDPVTGNKTFEEVPIHPDVPVHFAGGGGVTLTHPIAKDDEGTILYLSRSISPWRQSGGLQQPLNNSVNHPGDSVLLPGVRSDPRKIQAVSTSTAQLRSDDGHHTIDHDPASGTTIKSVDPSTSVASASFNPFQQATKFISHAVEGAKGLLAQAVTGGTTHDHGIDYGSGPFMRAANALHSVLCHPTNGASLNAENLLHSVLAHPSLGALLSAANGAHTVKATPGGVQIASSAGVSISCPPGMLSLPTGGVSGSSIQGGGDISGTLDKAQVVSILNVSNANLLPNAANDSAAAALNPPVAVGSLYRNGSVLMVRLT